MKNQRGVVLVYLIAALALVAALGTIVFKLDQRGYNRGKAVVEAQVAQRDNEALLKALGALKLAQDRVRALEDQSARDQLAAATKLRKELADVTKRKDSTIAALNDGTLRLRVQLANSTPSSSGNSTSAVGSSRFSNNGAEKSGLLGAADSAFLVNLASEADTVVAQLTAAQQALIKDREVCR